jgi:monoamine oxidase
LVGWAGGPKAKALLENDDERICASAVSSLARILLISEKEVTRHLSKCFVHNWKTDPFSRGGYSYLGVGGLDAQRMLAMPIDDTIYFAGEATAIGHVGTVHGAISSGYRAAKQALAG